MFGSNSPGCPERAADQRVRLAHPFFPNSIINQHLQALRRVQRQPLTVLSDHRIVKTSLRFLDDFLRGDRTKNTAPKDQRDCPDQPRSRRHQLHQRRRPSRRVRIVPSSGSIRKPRHRNEITSHASTKPYSTLLAQPNHHPTKKPGIRAYRAEPVQRTSSITASQAITTNGPCRNRTYDLAIKSRLLCQLR